MTPETRAVLANAALALSAVANRRALRGPLRELVGGTWLQVNQHLGGGEDAPAPALTAYARHLGLASGTTRQELAEATLLAAIAECAAAGISRDQVAAILSRAYLGGQH